MSRKKNNVWVDKIANVIVKETTMIVWYPHPIVEITSGTISKILQSKSGCNI
jgi:hypothetical protein